MRALRTTGKGYVNGWSVPVLLIGLLGVVVWVYAGDLDPPPGPIAPTMKTLDQVEARTPVQALPGDGSALHVISEPGSYYLTAAIAGEAGRDGIRIAASDVNLDLNGFTLRGVAGSGNGIRVEGTDGAGDPIDAVTVGNGVVRGWGANGLLIEEAVGGDGSRVVPDRLGPRSTSRNEERRPARAERAAKNAPGPREGFRGMDVLAGMVIADNAGHGLVAGDYVRLEDVSLVNNAGNGAVLGSHIGMEEVDFTGNGRDGAVLDSYAYMERVSFAYNVGCGLTAAYGLRTESYTHMEEVMFYDNGQDGALLGDGSYMEEVWFVSNTGHGVVAGANCTVNRCMAAGNGGDGLVVGAGSVLERFVSLDNGGHGVVAASPGKRMMINVDAYSGYTAGNGGSGFVGEGACNLRNCVATENCGDGIIVGAGSRVQSCSAHGNVEDGIEVSDNCRVVGNVVRANGENGPHAGIQVTGSHNRIEGNDATDNNNVGIGVADAGNVIIRNCCAGNQVNFSIAVGNILGSVTTPLMGRSDGRGGSADYGNVNFDLP